jgi:sec-independent protein translocase protein TatA
MGEIGIEKLILLMIVVLLLFGAKRIPEIGQSLGRGLREFKRSVSDINKEIVLPPQPPAYTRPEPPPADVTTAPPADPKRLL